MRDIYEEVTQSIVAELERGAVPWLKPWRNGASGQSVDMPRNAISKRDYSGINIFLLWSDIMRHGYATPCFLTYRQAQQAGGNVRKGEHGAMVVFYRRIEKKNRKADGTESIDTIPLLRTYTVFNVAQCDNLPATLTQAKPLPTAPELDKAYRDFVGATAARVNHGGDRAYYSPGADYVQMPFVAAFNSLDSYKATALHELTHWTGTEKRCNRQFGKRFGDGAYAFEELVAEIGAAFLCAHLGIAGELRHAGYIANWLKVLNNDKRAIFTAASQASKAANFLRAFSEKTAEGEDDTEELKAA